MIQTLKDHFKKHFDRTDGTMFFSPGRVNLIGEHIDYNGGFVFPCALSYGTYGIAAKRDDDLIRLFSEPFSTSVYTFSITHIESDVHNHWVDYIKGSIKALLDHGYHIQQGIDLYLIGTMPFSAGLSSSASLEMLVISILNHLFKLNLGIKTMALLGKEAENKFVGVQSGIMDQFAVIAGKKDYAILLDTSTLDYEYVPIKMNDDALLIVNTNKKRGLADSKYNERFEECHQALDILKSSYTIRALCDLSVHDLPSILTKIHPLLYKRVQHVVTEHHRTIKAKEALKQGDIKAFAHLMNQSHRSLKDDYEVTGTELDTLQEELLRHGAIGARMTGAGFGGCVVAIVPKDLIEKIKVDVDLAYYNKIGYKPTFYEVNISDGTHIIT